MGIGCPATLFHHVSTFRDFIRTVFHGVKKHSRIVFCGVGKISNNYERWLATPAREKDKNMKRYSSAWYTAVTVAAFLGLLLEAHAAGPGGNPAVAGRPGAPPPPGASFGPPGVRAPSAGAAGAGAATPLGYRGPMNTQSLVNRTKRGARNGGGTSSKAILQATPRTSTQAIQRATKGMYSKPVR